MLDKLTENMKFFLILVVYVIYMTWWAASLTTTVEQNTLVIGKTVEVLDAHITECAKKEARGIRAEEILKQLRKDVDTLLKR